MSDMLLARLERKERSQSSNENVKDKEEEAGESILFVLYANPVPVQWFPLTFFYSKQRGRILLVVT